MTPLAAVSVAAATGQLPRTFGAPKMLGKPLVAAGALAMAAGELAGDKWKGAPDRIVVAGLLGRLVGGGIAAMSVARRNQRWLAAALGAGAAIASSYPTFHARMRAMGRWSQLRTGLVEDTLIVGAAILLVRAASRQAATAGTS
jgi:hypothetical protein